MQNSVWFFLQVLLKSTAVLALAWVLVVLFRKKSSALRHQILTVALVCLLCLPVFITALPVWRMPLSAKLWNDAFLIRTVAHSSQSTKVAQRRALPASLTSSQHLNGNLLTVLWAIGTVASLAQILAGWVGVERLRRHTVPLNLPELQPLAHSLGINQTIDLRQSAAGSMPITYGVVRPTILLPSDVLTWSEGRRRAVLLHELAHVQRRDFATQLLGRFTLAIYWWHPFVWFAWREFLKEREQAADDLVLHFGASATDYAGHLLAIARSMRVPEISQSVAIAMARPNQLETRLAAILDSRRIRTAPKHPTTLAAVAIALVVAAPLAALQSNGSTVPRFSAKIVSDPNTRAATLISQGKMALKAKDYSAAITFFQNAISADPGNPTTANFWMGITELRRGNWAAAAEFCRKALTTADLSTPDSATIMEMESSALTQLQRLDEAQKLTAQAQAIRTEQVNQEAASHPRSSSAYKIGNGIKPPTLINKVEPEYSEDARLALYSGAVLLDIEIGTDGIARNFAVLRPLGFGLDEKAIEAVKKWRFQPGTKDGEPVVVTAHVEVSFRLL